MKRQDDGVDVQGKQPGFWFYPADYERDMAPLPLEAQALWMRMLCRMHFAAHRGYLEHPTGQAITPEELARIVGLTARAVSKLLNELERCGIFSRDEYGTIFNRRMVRDTQIGQVRRAAAAARLVGAERGKDGTFAGSKPPAKQPSKQNFAGTKHPAKPEQNTVPSVSSSVSVQNTSPTPSTELRVVSGRDAPDLDPRGKIPIPSDIATEMPQVVRSAPEFLRDESLAPLREIYSQAGAPVIDEDWIEAHAFWRKLDFEQKLERVKAARERIEAGTWADPVFIPRPRKFIEREWKRPIAVPKSVRAKPQRDPEPDTAVPQEQLDQKRWNEEHRDEIEHEQQEFLERLQHESEQRNVAGADEVES
jgi:hypothetical protein